MVVLAYPPPAETIDQTGSWLVSSDSPVAYWRHKVHNVLCKLVLKSAQRKSDSK